MVVVVVGCAGVPHAAVRLTALPVDRCGCGRRVRLRGSLTVPPGGRARAQRAISRDPSRVRTSATRWLSLSKPSRVCRVLEISRSRGRRCRGLRWRSRRCCPAHRPACRPSWLRFDPCSFAGLSRWSLVEPPVVEQRAQRAISRDQPPQAEEDPDHRWLSLSKPSRVCRVMEISRSRGRRGRGSRWRPPGCCPAHRPACRPSWLRFDPFSFAGLSRWSLVEPPVVEQRAQRAISRDPSRVRTSATRWLSLSKPFLPGLWKLPGAWCRGVSQGRRGSIRNLKIARFPCPHSGFSTRNCRCPPVELDV